MNVTVAKVSKDYKSFMYIALGICKDNDIAQDLVQTMFVKLIELEQKEGNLNRLSFNNELNKYFAYRIMLNLFINEKKRNSKNKASVYYCDPDELPDTPDPTPNQNQLESEYQEAKDNLLEEVSDTLKELHWYDALLFKEYATTDISFRKLSEETGISARSIFNTVNNVRKEIKENTRPSKINGYKNKKRNL